MGRATMLQNLLRQDLIWGQALSTQVALGRKGRGGSRSKASLIVFGQPTTGPADPVINTLTVTHVDTHVQIWMQVSTEKLKMQELRPENGSEGIN